MAKATTKEKPCNDENEEDTPTEMDLGCRNEAIIKHQVSAKKIISDAFSDYCGHSSIHGIQYLGEAGRHWVERIVWSIFILSSVIICSKFINILWIKWDETPVIVTFSERATPIWNIPFPAITICPQIKTRKNIFNFTDFHTKWKNGQVDKKNEKFKYFASLSFICDSDLIQDIDFSSNESIDVRNALKDIAPTKDDVVALVESRNLDVDRNSMKKVITDSGICFTFNGLRDNEIYRYKTNLHFDDEFSEDSSWTLENGYKRTEDNMYDLIPHHVVTAGINEGIDIHIAGYEPDNDYLCRGPVAGFNVLVHSPDELPRLGEHNFRVPFNKEIIVNVDPVMTTTSSGLIGYDPERRQCFFNSERKLKYFKYYTENNCKIECLANYTHLICNGCVPFWIPVPSKVRICNATEIKCVQNAISGMHLLEYYDAITSQLGSVPEKEGCNCLPACTSISYWTDITQADYDFKKRGKKHQGSIEGERNDGILFSRIKVGFHESQFLSSRRSELYGTSDFIANCGGLLGLFMGISALSFVEIVYFCSFRILTKIKWIKIEAAD